VSFSYHRLFFFKFRAAKVRPVKINVRPNINNMDNNNSHNKHSRKYLSYDDIPQGNAYTKHTSPRRAPPPPFTESIYQPLTITQNRPIDQHCHYHDPKNLISFQDPPQLNSLPQHCNSQQNTSQQNTQSNSQQCTTCPCSSQHCAKESKHKSKKNKRLQFEGVDLETLLNTPIQRRHMPYHPTPSTTPPTMPKVGDHPSAPPDSAPSYSSDSGPAPSYSSVVLEEDRVMFMAPIFPHTYYPGQYTPHEDVRYVLETPVHTYPPHHPYYMG